MHVFVPDVDRPKRARGKEVLTHWPQCTVALTQSKDGLTVQLLYLQCALQGLTRCDLKYTSIK